MSTEGPRDRDARPGEDPFAFAPDERDELEASGAPVTPSAGDPGEPAPDPAEAAREAERAARRAEADRVGREARASSTRWLVAGGLLLAVLAVGSTFLAGRGGQDAGQVRPGERLPAFAAPLATMPRVEHDDVNLAERDGQGELGRRAACSVRVASAVTSCALLRRGPLVLVVYGRGVGSCVRAVDDVDAVTASLRGVSALAVETRGSHDETARTVRARGWRLPVAYDADAALASRLGAAVCPLVLFVRQDATVADRLVGKAVTRAAIRARAVALVRPASAGARAPAGR